MQAFQICRAQMCGMDYAALMESIVDTRNATRSVEKGRERIVLA